MTSAPNPITGGMSPTPARTWADFHQPCCHCRVPTGCRATRLNSTLPPVQIHYRLVMVFDVSVIGGLPTFSLPVRWVRQRHGRIGKLPVPADTPSYQKYSRQHDCPGGIHVTTAHTAGGLRDPVSDFVTGPEVQGIRVRMNHHALRCPDTCAGVDWSSRPQLCDRPAGRPACAIVITGIWNATSPAAAVYWTRARVRRGTHLATVGRVPSCAAAKRQWPRGGTTGCGTTGQPARPYHGGLCPS